MASLALSLFTAFIASLLVCQMATSPVFYSEPQAYGEATTMSTEDGREERKNLEKSSNETKKTNDMTDTAKKNNESDVELMSRTFDTSLLTLKKFTAVNSNLNKDNRSATTVTDDSNSDIIISETLGILKPNSSKENSNGERKCDENRRGKEQISNVPERGSRNSINSSAGTNSDTDMENAFSRILEESDTARMIMKEFSALNQIDAAARLLTDPMPLKALSETEELKTTSNENLEKPVEPITMSFNKQKVMQYVADSPDVMEATEVTTAAEGDLSDKENESDTVTSNAMKRITSENENKKGMIQRGESARTAATSKFADFHNVTKTRKNSDGLASYYKDLGVPETRFYADDKKKEDGDARETKEYLKKVDDKWISIVINNYPSHVCNKEKM